MGQRRLALDLWPGEPGKGTKGYRAKAQGSTAQGTKGQRVVPAAQPNESAVAETCKILLRVSSTRIVLSAVAEDVMQRRPPVFSFMEMLNTDRRAWERPERMQNSQLSVERWPMRVLLRLLLPCLLQIGRLLLHILEV